MGIEQVIRMTQELFLVALLVALPALVVSLVVGLVVSIFQTVTSIQDQTLSYVPRIILVGLAIVVTYTTTVAWIGFSPIFHLPNAVLLAITVGLLELVPVIGPVISAVLVALVAAQQSGIVAAGLLFGFAIALRLSIDNLVGPLVLGEAAHIHPVVIIISFVCGAILFGVVGLLIAVPVAVCIKITLTHYYAEPVARNDRRTEGRRG